MSKEYEIFNYVHIVNTDMNDPDEKHALVYADIDGYPADFEDEEGSVICRIWLLNQPANNMNDRKFIVDWHHNGYRNNESVLGLIKQAKEDLVIHVGNIVEQIFNKAYDKNRLRWMLDHGHSIGELLMNLQDRLDKGADDIYEALDYFETTVGFGDILEIWPDRDEFRDSVWKNECDMKELLCGTDYKIWYNNRK